jgi:hypothetical protein
MLCGVWVYVGFLGTEHGRAITPTIQQLLTGGRVPAPVEMTADFGSLVGMLGDGSDSFGVVDVGVGFADWGRRVEQLVA